MAAMFVAADWVKAIIIYLNKFKVFMSKVIFTLLLNCFYCSNDVANVFLFGLWFAISEEHKRKSQPSTKTFWADDKADFY